MSTSDDEESTQDEQDWSCCGGPWSEQHYGHHADCQIRRLARRKDEMSDIVERAEAWRDHGLGSDPVPDLIAELKSARAEDEQMSSDSKWIIYKHVLPLMRPWLVSAPEDTTPGVFWSFDTHAEALAFVNRKLKDSGVRNR